MKKLKTLLKQSIMRKLNYCTLFIGILFFIACEKNELTNDVNITTPNINDPELAFPNKSGTLKKGFYLGMPITYEVIDNQYIINGDIMLPKNQVYDSMEGIILEPGQKPSAHKIFSAGRSDSRWPNNTVYYSIDPNLPNKYRATDAIRHWESKTNLKFIQRTNQPNYVYFYSGPGCSSHVGMQGGIQYISLAGGCTTGAAIHEIGHAVGLFHEHARADRDQYVTIHWQNIQSGTAYNFETYLQRGYRGSDNTAFDFNSIMMYGAFSFTINSNPTITKLNGNTYQHQRNGLSRLDIQGINKMYPASGTGGGGGNPTYVNGQWYTVHGLRVYRYSNVWWYQYHGTWRQVEYVNNQWQYVK
ncbi:Peptidase M12 [Tenacibaculum sp. 190524A02b]|uniref:Peptidase M12 n=2 Tax=Tenacibaculum vairaonense TaxID=3137860 RepID=A0ABP1F3Z6_9FLAO